MDIVAKVRSHPKPGQTVLGENFQFVPGGKGANQAIAAKRLGGNVVLFGKIGNDHFGHEILNFYKKERLNLKNLLISQNGQTGIAVVMVNKKGENTIVVSSGSNNNISPKETEQIKINRSDIILATLEIPYKTTGALFKRAKKLGAITILNAAPAITIPNNIIKLSDYLVVNESELAFYAKIQTVPKTLKEITRAANKIRAKNKVVIVTLGKKGLVAITNEEILKIPGHKVNAVDTTAAGDCFVGALATALSENQELNLALKFANATAAISTEKYGASSSLPSRNALKKFLTKQPWA